MHAYADESYVEAAQTYVVGAAIVPTAQLLAVRKAAVSVLQPGRKWKQKPFHWRTERHGRRISLLADTVLALNLPAICVSADHVAPGQEEIARVACLELLLLELVKQNAVGIIIDRRSDGQLKRDRQTMIEFHKRNILPPGFLYGFLYPSEDPAVWLGDALAGAMGEEFAGDLRYTTSLGGQLLRLSSTP